MPRWDDPPHAVSTYTVTTARDAGGGEALTYTLAQSGVPCLINTASANTVEQYAQSQIRVSHTVGFKSAVLSTPLTRGMKIVADDTGGTYRVEGIRSGRAVGNIPAFTYADVSELL